MNRIYPLREKQINTQFLNATNATKYSPRRLDYNVTEAFMASDHFSVQLVKKPLNGKRILKTTRKRIQELSHINAICAVNHTPFQAIWNATSGYTVENDHIFAVFVINSLYHLGVWPCTSENIRVTSPIPVRIVRRRFIHPESWNSIWLHILTKSHTSVMFVKRVLQIVLTWGNMWRYMQKTVNFTNAICAKSHFLLQLA